MKTLQLELLFMYCVDRDTISLKLYSDEKDLPMTIKV
jgi:hypothetical protein